MSRKVLGDEVAIREQRLDYIRNHLLCDRYYSLKLKGE